MIYDRYAEVYDRSGQSDFSERARAYLDRLLPRHQWTGRSVLDLACGTGTLALALARQGFRVTGVDASPAMLAAAQAKAADAGLSITFLCQDMRELRLSESVDLAVCFYDSINYLLSLEDLARTFGRVAAALAPGGLFVFDTTTPSMYESLHPGTHFAEVGGVVSVMVETYEPETRLVTTDVNLFVPRGELYERIVERHVQRAYTEPEVGAALVAAGLREEGRYVCFGFDPPAPDTGRIAWVARKMG